eukprot:2110382-Amphidinium_carterae.2
MQQDHRAGEWSGSDGLPTIPRDPERSCRHTCSGGGSAERKAALKSHQEPSTAETHLRVLQTSSTYALQGLGWQDLILHFCATPAPV